WERVKRIFRYIRGTTMHGILYGTEKERELVMYSDADFGGDFDTRRSTTGYISVLGGGAVTWCSRRQSLVALSTAEAELISATEATKELLWLQILTSVLDVSAIQLFVDNQSAIYIACNERVK